VNCRDDSSPKFSLPACYTSPLGEAPGSELPVGTAGAHWKILRMVWRNRNPNAVLVGLENGTVALENNLAVSQVIKHETAIWLGNSTARYLPKRHKNTC